MGPAQIAALDNCGIQVEDATGDIKFREFEFIDVIKPGTIRFQVMNLEHLSSKQQGDDKTKELEKKVEDLKKILDLQQRTIEHDRQHFGQQYEMI